MYDINVFSLNNVKKVNDCVNYMNSNLSNNKIIVHLDELDYGCGIKQNMSSVINEFKNVATPEVAQKEFLDSSYKYVYAGSLHDLCAVDATE